ncbi:ALP1-like protein isoform X1 [Tanacetum coccineum]
MSRTLFTSIVEEVTLHCAYFRDNINYQKTRHIPVAEMGEATSRLSLQNFAGLLWKILEQSICEDPLSLMFEKLYAFHEQKHRFSGMLESLDCTYWRWFGCPQAYQGQHVRRDHGRNPFVLLKVVASQDLWI